MKSTGFLLLVLGFLAGAYATALDVESVNWALFVLAVLAAVAGILIVKRAESAHAQSETVLETNRNELRQSLDNVVRDLQKMTSTAIPEGEALRAEIDNRLRDDLRRFAEARESMVHLFGLQAYADIMSSFAAGERYINRVWSASVDGYDKEAETYLHRAARQFADAQGQLKRAANNAA
jgi:membrane protein implicated in regulation of membrane protease activity